MTTTLTALLLCTQLFMFRPAAAEQPLSASQSRCILAAAPRQASSIRLWWGMIDPELSAWFARIPDDEDKQEQRILWDWSWRGFLASIFGQTAETEDAPDAASL